jgi:hypothetical protein
MVALPIRLSSDLSPACLRCHRAFDLSPCQLTCPYQVTFDFSDWSPLAGDRSDGCTPIRLCSDLSPVTLRIDLSPFCSANPVPRFDRCPVGLLAPCRSTVFTSSPFDLSPCLVSEPVYRCAALFDRSPCQVDLSPVRYACSGTSPSFDLSAIGLLAHCLSTVPPRIWTCPPVREQARVRT